MKITFDTNKVLLYGLALIGIGVLLHKGFELARAAYVLYLCAHHGGC